MWAEARSGAMPKRMAAAALVFVLTAAGCSGGTGPQAEGSSPSPTVASATPDAPPVELFATEDPEPLPVLPDAGCGFVTETENLSRRHIPDGEPYDFPEFPVPGGPHDEQVLPAGVYDRLTDGPAGANEPTILRAMHSLEHGYVLMLHEGLSETERKRLIEAFGYRHKIIIAGGADLPAEIVLLVWGRTRYCRDVAGGQIQEFVNAYLEGHTAPEPDSP